jgi:HAD superfamily hydrolase (TIGR01509 family)
VIESSLEYPIGFERPFIPAAVIFDMDGLMLDTEKPMIDSWIQAAEKLGRRLERKIILDTIGKDEAATRAIFVNAYGKDFPYRMVREEAVRSIIQKAESEGIPHRPGLLVLLDCLKRRNIPMAVATSTDRKIALWKLEKAGVRERFAVLVCGDEVGRGKPAPDIFLLAAERLEKQPASCIGFEDSPAGLAGLRAAGIPSVFVKDILEPPPEILAGVWRRYDNLAEACELFEAR